jgi:hypothetical protein
MFSAVIAPLLLLSLIVSPEAFIQVIAPKEVFSWTKPSMSWLVIEPLLVCPLTCPVILETLSEPNELVHSILVCLGVVML